MCGFAGLVDFSGNISKETIKKSIDFIHHRGPDDEGIEGIFHAKYTALFGFKRLAIIDLTPAGHQPMFSPDGNIILVFNGEIYNYKQLRKELTADGIKCTSESDTEVILHLYSKYGISFIEKLNGMFAIALLDIAKNKLYLIRDRVGVKPLYYRHIEGGNIYFASELKALLPLIESRLELNLSAVGAYFSFGYIPAPDTIYTGIKKLLSAHFLEYDLNTRKCKTERYWSINPAPEVQSDFGEAMAHLECLMKDAFRLRMVADVPVGVFLSGGYDSTAVTALLQADRTERLRTFTIGFEDADYDESPHAEAIARHLGTDHTTLYCRMQDAIDFVPKLPYFYDEPFGDSSAVPTMLVSRLARQYVTVSLSADGGDELFAGYPRHLKALRQLNKIISTPNFLKKIVRILSNGFPPQSNIGKYDFLSKFRNYLRYPDVSRLFLNQLSVLSSVQIQHLVKSTPENDAVSSVYIPDLSGFTLLSKVLLTDFYTYLPEDILTKVDRATMSVSLEGREPLLDYRLVEYAFRLNDDFKIQNNAIQKYILKQIVHKYVPKNLMERPKMGFGIPVHRWLRNELKWMLYEYLDETKLKQQDFLNYKAVKQCVNAFLNQEKNVDHQRVWFLLIFQMWFDHWVEGRR